jgi:hypothetical protein
MIVDFPKACGTSSSSMSRLDRPQIAASQCAPRPDREEANVRKERQLPRLRFFFVEDEVNDFAQVRVNLFVILSAAVASVAYRGRNRLEENGFELYAVFIGSGSFWFRCVLYLTGRL